MIDFSELVVWYEHQEVGRFPADHSQHTVHQVDPTGPTDDTLVIFGPDGNEVQRFLPSQWTGARTPGDHVVCAGSSRTGCLICDPKGKTVNNTGPSVAVTT